MDKRTLALYIHSCYTDSELRWSPEKDEKLRRERGASFFDLLGARVVEAKDHPSRPHQRLIFVEFRDYIWVIPLVWRDGEVFLKTAYPSRSQTRSWRGGRPT